MAGLGGAQLHGLGLRPLRRQSPRLDPGTGWARNLPPAVSETPVAALPASSLALMGWGGPSCPGLCSGGSTIVSPCRDTHRSGFRGKA